MSRIPSSIGPYQVLAPLGDGGMGVVYRARDTKLNRDIAIKVLPEAFALDAERLARFAREAQVLASLNHPNIAAIYGIEEQGGSRALVMELVEGEDLSQRIARGAIPLDEALPIARQIAEALEAAHEQGIVHRDLKPANVKVRPDGTVKVLDFGLAKGMEPGVGNRESGAGDTLANSPTITTPAMTMHGMILGTAAYMSPEQAKGRVVDKRADIWAFGVVLFEMLTGRRVFDGEDTSEVLAAVLRQDIPWSGLAASTPPRLKRLLERCLDRDARTRLRDIGEARVELVRIESGAPEGEASTSARASQRSSYREAAAWAIAVLTLVAALAIYLRPSAPAPDQPLMQLALAAPDGVTFETSNANNAAIAVSPDGRLVVFGGRSVDGTRRLYVRPLDGREATALPGTEDAINPFWSPDSRAVAFGSQGKLQRIDLAGGKPIILTDAPFLTSGAWGRNGQILFVRDFLSGILKVPDRGGVATEVVAPEASSGGALRSPDFVADGQRFLFSRGEKIRWASVASPAGGEVTEGRSPRFVPPDRLLFARGDTLFAALLDGETMTIIGEPLPVLPADGQASITAAFSASKTGVLVWSQPWTPDSQLTWFSRQGAVLGDLGDEHRSARGVRQPRVSPDGTQVATQVRGAGQRSSGIWVIDLVRRLPIRVFATGSGVGDSGQLPRWSNDGRHLIFTAVVNGVHGIYQKSANGLGAPELLVRSGPEAGGLAFASDWSSDGRYLLYWARGNRTRGDVWALPLTGDRQPFPVLNTEFDEVNPTLSPDSRWIAYQSDASGTSEIYVQSFTAEGRAGGDHLRISTGGGRQPRFRSDGRELFYRADDGRLMAVTINGSGAIAGHGEPQALFNAGSEFDVSPDGQRFLVNAARDGSAPPAPTIVLNWTAGLKK